MTAEIPMVEMVGLDSEEESDFDLDESSQESHAKDPDYEEENENNTRCRLLANKHRLENGREHADMEALHLFPASLPKKNRNQPKSKPKSKLMIGMMKQERN